MDRSKDRTMYQNGYDDPFASRRQREMPSDRYQDDYDGEDIYQEIMKAGRRQQPSYDQDYMGRTPMQGFEPEYDTYQDYQEPPRMTRPRTPDQEPLYGGRMKEPMYGNERMPNMGAQDSYGYGGGFSNEPIDSLLDSNYSQPLPPRGSSYEGTSQYQNMDLYEQELPPRRSRNRNTMQEDAFLRKDQTSSFRYEEPMPRRNMRQPERQAPLQETQRMRLRPQMEQMDTGAAYTPEEAPIAQPKPRKASMTLSEEFEASKNKKNRFKKEKAPKVKRKETTHVKESLDRAAVPVNTHSLKEFAKWNIIIFLAAFVNITAFTLVTASFVYMSYFNNFALQSDLVNQIVQFCILLSLIFAYVTAGLHCGYHMLINKIKPLHPALKIILSPFILIFTEIAGIVCEIPYLIYSVIKS